MSVESNTEIGDISSQNYLSTSVEWKIEDFFSLLQNVNYAVNSPCFSFLGETWYIRMVPNAESVQRQSDKYIGLYLIRKQSCIPNQRVRYTLKMRTKDGTELKSFPDEYEFQGQQGRGLHQFIARSQLVKRRAEFSSEGVVIISCDVYAQKSETITASSQTEFHEGMDKLGKVFKELFLSGEESDLALNVQGHEFKCHRAILSARSSIFAAMLRLDVLERTKGIVQIDDCEPEAFQEFLIYLYSGSVEEFTEENVFGLYQIADKYDAPEVKARCVHLLIIYLCLKNFCNVVELALKYNEFELLQEAVIFFARNTKSILVMPSWQNFITKNPTGANELYLKALDIK